MTMTQVKSRTIAVEHITISSERPFTEVRRKLEGAVPKLDTNIAEALVSGDQDRAKDYEEERAKTVDLRRARSWRLVADCGQEAQRDAI